MRPVKSKRDSADAFGNEADAPAKRTRSATGRATDAPEPAPVAALPPADPALEDRAIEAGRRRAEAEAEAARHAERSARIRAGLLALYPKHLVTFPTFTSSEITPSLLARRRALFRWRFGNKNKPGDGGAARVSFYERAMELSASAGVQLTDFSDALRHLVNNDVLAVLYRVDAARYAAEEAAWRTEARSRAWGSPAPAPAPVPAQPSSA